MANYPLFNWSAILSEVTEKLIEIPLGRVLQLGERVRKCALIFFIQIPLRYVNRGSRFERARANKSNAQRVQPPSLF